MKNSNATAIRAVVAGVVILALAGAGAAFAFGGGLPKPAADYSLTKATTGSITQTWSGTGTVARSNQAVLTFGSSGVVSEIKVKIGDAVAAGDVVATIDPTQLELSAVIARAGVQQAQAQLDTDQAAASGTTTSAAASAASGTASALAGLQAQLQTLSAKLAAANAASATDKAAAAAATLAKQKLVAGLVAALASTDCTATFAAGVSPGPGPVPPPSPTPSPIASPSPSLSASPTPSATPSDTASPSPSATPTDTPSPSATATPSPSTTPSSSPLATTLATPPSGPTAAQVTGCRALLEKVVAAAEASAPQPGGASSPSTAGSASAPAGAGSTTRPTTSAASGTAAAASSSSSSTKATGAAAGVGAQSSEVKVANDKVALLQAQQNLATAQAAVESASLTSPIAGRVAAISLVNGQAAGTKSVTVIGEGAATVSTTVPLSVRPLINTGLKATVSVPGSTASLVGSVTQVNLLATAGSASGSPTYGAVVTVDDPQNLLFGGGIAAVSVALGSVDGVTVLPGSAVTPTGTGTGTVQVPGTDGSAAARTVTVTTGATGQGLVQILSGVNAGDTVILADRSAAVPANSNQRAGSARSTTATAASSAAPTPAATPTR
ncbi:HlyD family efflux transporter periplasmic adaptor subunit [Propioniciclava tarda]|uniref:HlyD family efflux transporter periplasmic adaptor subunit n=1 Tax=Propioniciclava tarda TaxID=433330 RepID=A0A4Q9KIN8_PROTD|nr:HlyD family efflux transporter periplasmic adaptor subunit [Propioniciclava tarda]TBT94282.1 HlyD family efflux transporter periplasmic adaptor subunit [Propioniciclava tarda]SMO73847.1 Biotin-lipoyl like [Propioniciclava tarda]